MSVEIEQSIHESNCESIHADLDSNSDTSVVKQEADLGQGLFVNSLVRKGQFFLRLTQVERELMRTKHNR